MESGIGKYLPSKDNDFSSFNKEVLLFIIESVLSTEKMKSEIIFLGGISEEFEIKNISDAHNQSRKITNFLQQNHYKNIISQYSDLGIFKLFLQANTLNLMSFVPEELQKLYIEDYELFQTLYIYLKNNKNYTLTAEEMYLHPKTIKYRINQINEKVGFDFNNFYDSIVLSVSVEILHQQTIKEESGECCNGKSFNSK